MAFEESWAAMEAGSPKGQRRSLCLVLAAFLGSNVVSLYLGISWRSALDMAPAHTPATPAIAHRAVDPQTVASLVAQLNFTHEELLPELLQLRRDLAAAQELSKSLLAAARGCLNSSTLQERGGNAPNLELSLSAGEKSTELAAYTCMQRLPLGWSTGMAASAMVSPIGHGCWSEANQKDLVRYMDYDVGGMCPDDQGLAQTLKAHGCEPLPRRRCFSRMPPRFAEPLPLPQSLWSVPPDDSILWTPYTCKSFQCLNDRKKKKVFEDCIDCFELNGREKQRWTKHGSQLDFSIDEVLLLKPGSIRIGLDIGGGTGTFAVRMREKNVTVVTTSLNLNGPFNNVIAMRGVVPLFITIAQRLPFFDNTLDIVHSMHVLSNWIPTSTLEFLLFDIDRVLRPGGLLWLDHFFCIQHQLDTIYLPLIEKLGYRKLRWAVGRKLDRGPDLQEVYLSAVLEKPIFRI